MLQIPIKIEFFNNANKIDIVLTDELMFDTINNNLTYLFHEFNSYCQLHLSAQGDLNKFYKINAFLLDQEHIDTSQIPLFRINHLINITKNPNSLLRNSILLPKPFKLQDLINKLIKIQAQGSMFCCVNYDWIYNELSSTFTSQDQIIHLTNKENLLLKALLGAKNYKISKQSLRYDIWRYHPSSESSTLETHIYKLKQKLPSILLDSDHTDCYLNIKFLQ
jgi:hypothetical protein